MFNTSLDTTKIIVGGQGAYGGVLTFPAIYPPSPSSSWAACRAAAANTNRYSEHQAKCCISEDKL
ncbi:hypothetical protein E2C01_009493 [Portunus trituberculatus]|uniref:Uncharacterized protein n=1 Tax=Portunus trituberculatus TaxID=210409 RepID=A0A5B7D5Y8_PORTR|nr:hypothetical protein [Portunus trituberculatus]